MINYNCRSLVAAVPFFTNAEPEFVSSVVTKLQYEVFQPGEFLTQCGNFSINAYQQTWAAKLGNTQCGNFRIILLFRFSRKINFDQFEPPKTAILTIFGPSEFWNFGNVWHFQVWNFSKNQNSKPSTLLNCRQNSFHAKSTVRLPSSVRDSKIHGCAIFI